MKTAWTARASASLAKCPDQPERMRNADAKIYLCAKCGTMRSQNGGGTVFTLCDACWDKLLPKPGDVLLESPLGTQQLACGNRVPVANPTTISVQ